MAKRTKGRRRVEARSGKEGDEKPGHSRMAAGGKWRLLRMARRAGSILLLPALIVLLALGILMAFYLVVPDFRKAPQHIHDGDYLVYSVNGTSNSQALMARSQRPSAMGQESHAI